MLKTCCGVRVSLVELRMDLGNGEEEGSQAVFSEVFNKPRNPPFTTTSPNNTVNCYSSKFPKDHVKALPSRTDLTEEFWILHILSFSTISTNKSLEGSFRI